MVAKRKTSPPLPPSPHSVFVASSASLQMMIAMKSSFTGEIMDYTTSGKKN